MKASEGEKESILMRSSTSTTVNTTTGGLAGMVGGRRSRLLITLLFGVGIIAICVFAAASLHTGPGLRRSNFSEIANKWDILMITDLDKDSKVDDDDSTAFMSVLQAGTLSRDPDSGSYQVEFGNATDLYSEYSRAGRGMELSELQTFQGSLLAFGDRTGIVYEIVNDGEEDGEITRNMAPKYIVSAMDGLVDKAMKLEWATVKDGSMVMGSLGREYTTSTDGDIYNLWAVFIDEDGIMSREDWTEQYTILREATNTTFPGYMNHEAVAWSDKMNKWVFCPRRVSQEPYSDLTDEQMGSNIILITDENFEEVDVRHAGEIIPTHGFSSIKFVPGTDDQVIVALKSMELTVENDDDGSSESIQDTYIMVFNLDGEVLLEETEVPGDMKFEGIEIMSISAMDVE